jgi:hypothetical protein
MQSSDDLFNSRSLAEGMCLQVFRLEAGVLCDAGEHFRPDLILIMEREHEVGSTGT